LTFGFLLDTIKPWFLTEGKFADVLIIPSYWGSQLDGKKTSTPCLVNTHPSIYVFDSVSGEHRGSDVKILYGIRTWHENDPNYQFSGGV
jgi:hypothetical protein